MIEEAGNRGLGLSIVPGNDQRATVLGARRAAVGGELGGMDMVEGLDDLRGGKMRLRELRGRVDSSSGDLAAAKRYRDRAQ